MWHEIRAGSRISILLPFLFPPDEVLCGERFGQSSLLPPSRPPCTLESPHRPPLAWSGVWGVGMGRPHTSCSLSPGCSAWGHPLPQGLWTPARCGCGDTCRCRGPAGLARPELAPSSLVLGSGSGVGSALTGVTCDGFRRDDKRPGFQRTCCMQLQGRGCLREWDAPSASFPKILFLSFRERGSMRA